MVFEQVLTPVIREARSQAVERIEAFDEFAEQQVTAMGTDRAPVETSDHVA